MKGSVTRASSQRSALRWRAPALLAAMALASIPCVARAQQVEDCTVSSTAVAFGVYDPLSVTPLDGTGQISVFCRRTNSVAFVASLSAGGSGSYAARTMQSGTDTLQYNLFTNVARTIVFGDGSGGTATVLCFTGVTANGCIGGNPTGQGRSAVLPFYGRVPAGQNPASGNYLDTVMVTIEF